MSSILSIIKSIKTITDIIKMFVGLYESYQIKKATKAVKQVNVAKKILRTKLEEESKKETPDEEAIKDLHRRITNITIEL